MIDNIRDTIVETKSSDLGKPHIVITKLAGSEINTNVRLYDTKGNNNHIELNIRHTGHYWFIYLFSENRIYKDSIVGIHLDDSTSISIHIYVGASKYENYWNSIAIIPNESMLKLSEIGIKEVIISNGVRQIINRYSFGSELKEQPTTQENEREIFRFACVKLLEEYNKQNVTNPNKTLANHLPTDNVLVQSNDDGRILDRDYNLNTKYGRKMARRQAEYNYQHGSENYRNEIDNIGSVIWGIIIFICLVVFIIIWNVSGPEAAIKWLK